LVSPEHGDVSLGHDTDFHRRETFARAQREKF
jgi:hypothetical protein